jgi:hypothetical protein
MACNFESRQPRIVSTAALAMIAEGPGLTNRDGVRR